VNDSQATFWQLGLNAQIYWLW